MVTTVLIIAGFILLAEGFFQLSYRLARGNWYQRVTKVNVKEMFITPHPYLTFANKRNFRSAKTIVSARYPLHQDAGYYYPPVATNNLGHLDGPLGDRDVMIPKPAGQVRVLCLGASTTGNYIGQGGTTYSYPMALEALLQSRFPGQSIIVHNCGQGGWSSAEILVNYVLNLKDTQPDVVVIYHAYNDLSISLTPGFRSDYAHARKNLAASYYKYQLAAKIPMVPLGCYNFAVQKLFPFLNPRFGVLEAVSSGRVAMEGPFQGIQAYERNLESLIQLCRAEGVAVVLSTFAHYLYEDVKSSKVHLKYQEGLRAENEAIRRMADRYPVTLVDNAQLIPKDPRFFVDSIHFTPEGMQRLAENFVPAVAASIEEKLAQGSQEIRSSMTDETVHLHTHL